MSPRRVVIVGAGLAGSRCAEVLRAEGFTGEIVLVGEEAHRPYERPALSKELLAGRRDDVRLRPDEFWRERNRPTLGHLRPKNRRSSTQRVDDCRAAWLGCTRPRHGSPPTTLSRA